MKSSFCVSREFRIFCGLREGYSEKVHDLSLAETICQEYCDAVGLCVTITPTTYVYVKGREPGFIVGLINYPRFPKAEREILDHAMELAAVLKDKLGQLRVTVMGEMGAFMIGEA